MHVKMKSLLFFFMPVWMATTQGNPANDLQARKSPVGIYSEIRDLVLPGTMLEAKPLHQDTEIILRITATRPHGSSFRYDLSYCGLQQGEFDLCDYLQRKDGTSTDDLTRLPVEFDGVLAADRLQPNLPDAGKLPRIGGYWNILIVAGIIWVICPLILLLIKRRREDQSNPSSGDPENIADRLHPLVEAARDGRLGTAGQAKLERSLIGFWRERLNLQCETPVTALAQIRQHKEAGLLLEHLEDWLHKPNPQSPVDIEALLEPYRNAAEKTKECIDQ
jgi:hypothetical protein